MISRIVQRGWISRDIMVDRAMTFFGVALAGLVGALAIVQIASNDGAPKINGGEYLALFGRPKDIATLREQSSVAQGREAGVDFSSTASIGRQSAAMRGEPDDVPVRSASSGYRVQRVMSDRAFVDHRGRSIVLRVGDTAAEVGQLQAIVRRDGKWVAIIGPELRRGQTSR